MNNKKYILNKLLLILAGAAVLLSITLLTDPNTIALPLLIMPFILIGFLLYQISSVVVVLKKKGDRIFLAKIIPLSVAFLGVSLLLLGSLHQLTLNDSLLVFGFTILLWIYLWRADFLK